MHLFGIPGLLALFLRHRIGIELTVEKLFLDHQIAPARSSLLCVLLCRDRTQFFGLGLLGDSSPTARTRPAPTESRHP